MEFSFPSVLFSCLYLLVTTNSQYPQSFSPFTHRLPPSLDPGLTFFFPPRSGCQVQKQSERPHYQPQRAYPWKGYTSDKGHTHGDDNISVHTTRRGHGTAQIGFYTDGTTHRKYTRMGYRHPRGGHTFGRDLYTEETHTERAHIHGGNIHVKGEYTRRGHTSEQPI